jgi:hypothetical protein
LPALDFQQGDTTLLQQISFEALKLLRQVILIIPRVGGHRDECLFLKRYWIGDPRSAVLKNARQALKIVQGNPYFLQPEKISHSETV